MRLSIIIPVYNAQRFLGEAIDSAIRAGTQVQGGWELLLVDNNSTDGSEAVMQEYRQRYPDRIQLLKEISQGAPKARNAALAVARGEWVQFLDADDYLLPDKIADQLRLTDRSTAWVIGAYRNLYADGSTDEVYPATDPWLGLVDGLRIGNTNANLYRRDALARVGNWNEDTFAYDDPNLCLRFLQAELPYVISQHVSSIYRHHDGERVTGKDVVGQVRQSLDLHVASAKFLRQNKPDYWRQNAPYFRGALLRRVRTLATHDLDGATAAYELHFNDRTDNLPYELVPQYTRLYPYLGFRNLEWLRLALTRILPLSLKDKLKS